MFLIKSVESCCKEKGKQPYSYFYNLYGKKLDWNEVFGGRHYSEELSYFDGKYIWPILKRLSMHSYFLQISRTAHGLVYSYSERKIDESRFYDYWVD